MNTGDTPIFHDRHKRDQEDLSSDPPSSFLSDILYTTNVCDVDDTAAEKKKVWLLCYSIVISFYCIWNGQSS